MKDKVRIGLIGAGLVAQHHMAVIQAMEGVEAVGVTSRTLSKAREFASKFAIPNAYASMDDLMSQAKPDALMILVNEDQMFPVASQAISYGVPLFIEKPAGLTPEENRKLAELAKAKGIGTMVGFNRRYYSIFHKGMDMIRQHGPLLGVSIEGHERMWRVREGKKFSESVLQEWIYANSTHTIDLLRFFGGEIKSISSIAHSYIEKKGDQLAAVMELESGAIGQYSAHWYSPGGWRVVLYGDGVTVEFKPLESGVWTDKKFQTHLIEPESYDQTFKVGFYQQMIAFAKFVREGKLSWPMQDLNGAYQTMILAEKISLENKNSKVNA